jgi:DNA-binding NtrC family response regulator
MAWDIELRAMVREGVGQMGVREAELVVRRTMVAEALARSGGNRRAAARMLGVSRQHLQHILRALEIESEPRLTVNGQALRQSLEAAHGSEG